MYDSTVEIKVKTQAGSKIKRTISTHNDVEDLIKQINQFVQETDEVIKAGTELKVTCSKCCNGLECFKFKTKVKVKADGNNVSI